MMTKLSNWLPWRGQRPSRRGSSSESFMVKRVRCLSLLPLPSVAAALSHKRVLRRFMPFDSNAWSNGRFVPFVEMVDKIRGDVGPEFVRLGDEFFKAGGPGAVGEADDDEDAFARHSTAKLYSAPSLGWRGRVGFITSMSSAFCGGCNRIRLTADGHVKACLFGTEEVDIKPALRATSSSPRGDRSECDSARDDDDGQSDALSARLLGRAVGHAIKAKQRSLGGHSGMQELAKTSGENRSMIRIGG